MPVTMGVVVAERAPSGGPLPPAEEWRDVRCFHCRRLLARAKNTSRLLRPGEVLQIKCACNTMNYLSGAPDE